MSRILKIDPSDGYVIEIFSSIDEVEAKHNPTPNLTNEKYSITLACEKKIILYRGFYYRYIDNYIIKNENGITIYVLGQFDGPIQLVGHYKVWKVIPNDMLIVVNNLRSLNPYSKRFEIERWRIIEKYPNYKISNFGRIKKTFRENKREELVYSYISIEYKYVNLQDQDTGIYHKYRVSDLVAKYFIKNPLLFCNNPVPLPVVSYRDEFGNDAHWNLEWRVWK